jgi:carboxypeptidase family protein
MMMRRVARLAMLIALVWARPGFAQSQAINGTIEGTVTDGQGGVLPGVTVTITHIDTGTTRVVVTNETGTYRAPLLPLGTYKVDFTMQGFSKFTRSGITLTAGQTIVLNEALKVGVQEDVTVTADSPVVNLAKTDVGRNLTE